MLVGYILHTRATVTSPHRGPGIATAAHRLSPVIHHPSPATRCPSSTARTPAAPPSVPETRTARQTIPLH